MKRIVLNGGHTELGLAGTSYQADEVGAFVVPDEYASELIRVHGGSYEPGIEQLEERVAALEDSVGSAKNTLAQRTADLETARKALDASKKKLADAVSKKQAERKAADDVARGTQSTGHQQPQQNTNARK